jgi:DNA-binding GntR family transcriptional regulator
VAAQTATGAPIGARDRALTYVKQRVLTGAFRGGELISEGEVATALGMSRTPVREAFLRLEAEGLLRLYPQRGALVVPVSAQEVRAVMEARLVLEQFAARKLASQPEPVRDTVHRLMLKQLDRQRHAGGMDLDTFLDADRGFHSVLLDNARNAILADVYGSLRDRQMRMVGESAVRDPGRVQTILTEHTRIAEAIHAGNPDEALEAIRVHLTGTELALSLED